MSWSELQYLTAGQLYGLIVGALGCGIAICIVSHQLVAIILRPQDNQAQLWQTRQRRLIAMRRGSTLFRWFEPLILEVAETSFCRYLSAMSAMRKLTLSLKRGGHELPFQLEEYVAFSLFQALLSTIVLVPVGALYVSAESLILVSVFSFVGVFLASIRQVHTHANRRLNAFHRRMPFCVDLMALTMSSGAPFRESLETVVHEADGTEVGCELGSVQRQMHAGLPMNEAWEQLRTKLDDRQVDEIVLAIKNGQELGTPLSKIFIRIADQLRLRRVQRLEKMTGNAQAMMVFPGFIVMFACLLIIIAPFAISVQLQPPF